MNKPTVSIEIPTDRLSALLAAIDNAEQLAGDATTDPNSEQTMHDLAELHALLDAARFRRPVAA